MASDKKTSSKKKRAATSSRDKTRKKKAPAPPPARPATPRPQGAPLDLVVTVYEATNSARERACALLEELGARVTPETGAAEVAERCAGSVPPDVVLAALPEGAAIVRAVRGRIGFGPVIVAALPGPSTTAIERCDEVDADLFVVRPHGSEALAATLRAAIGLRRERNKVQTLESSETLLRERLQRYGQADVETGFQHFDFFQKVLVTEIKRAKRYGYPLAACLIALDPWTDGAPAPEVGRALRARVASSISACIRDIDLPVDLAEDRFLVFLPYTDLDGAERVGDRMAEVVRSFAVPGGAAALTVSIGIAATRPGKPISFARLMRDATAAVRASQLKGGGRVVVRR